MAQGEEVGKMFVGGLSWESSKDSLEAYFMKYGEVIDCVIMKDPVSGRSRGFGFVKFKDESCVQTVLSRGPHVLDNRTIDPKACTPRSQQQKSKQFTGRVKKVFIGGIPPNCSEADVKTYFSEYGNVEEFTMMYDQEQKRPRGFGFLSFESEEAVEKVCDIHFHQINGKTVECKKAEPRDSRPSHGMQGGQGSWGPGGVRGAGGPPPPGPPGGYGQGWPGAQQPGGYGPPQGSWQPPTQVIGYGGQQSGYPAVPSGGRNSGQPPTAGTPHPYGAGSYPSPPPGSFGPPPPGSYTPQPGGYGQPATPQPQPAYGAMGLNYAQEASGYGPQRIHFSNGYPANAAALAAAAAATAPAVQQAGAGYGDASNYSTTPQPTYPAQSETPQPAAQQAYGSVAAAAAGYGRGGAAPATQTFHPYRR
ncbi:DAZ-associated protein 1-like isoform X10 [Glandiceps talaboti]